PYRRRGAPPGTGRPPGGSALDKSGSQPVRVLRGTGAAGFRCALRFARGAAYRASSAAARTDTSAAPPAAAHTAGRIPPSLPPPLAHIICPGSPASAAIPLLPAA